MGFSELTFIFLFMPIAVLASLASFKWLGETANKAILVILSLCFYAVAGKKALCFFLMSIIVTYAYGRAMRICKNISLRKLLLFIFLLYSILNLAFYKYAPHYALMYNGGTTHNEADSCIAFLSSVVAPLGISFITFEMISYAIDIYRYDAEPGSLLNTFVFVSLFPKVISGPIVLWKDFSQDLVKRAVSLETISASIDRIIIGYAKKVIIADTLGAQIARINTEIGTVGVDSLTMWLKAIMFFFELYYDFAGYSDIAIGLCGVMGFSIEDNFKFPYLSKSVTEFWRRWHISLGRWFREYVYIPMGGSRTGNVYINLLTVFMLTGVWHGANYTYWIWGLANGIAVIVERIIMTCKWYVKIPNTIKWVACIIFIFFSWILFSASSISDFFSMIETMFTYQDTSAMTFTWKYFYTRKTIIMLFISAAGAFGIFDAAIKAMSKRLSKEMYRITSRIVLICIFILAILFAVNSTYSPFLYFQY